MSEKPSFEDTVEEIIKHDKRYKPGAYEFVMHALEYTYEMAGDRRHITGQELTESIRQYALREFGYLAREPLRNWGITETIDFGNIVYKLIDAEVLSKTDEDSHDDFIDVFDFKKGFDESFEFPDTFKL